MRRAWLSTRAIDHSTYDERDTTSVNVDEMSRSASSVDSRANLPETAPLLNDRDVEKILKRKLRADSSYRLVDWRLESLGEGKGFFGQYYHLHVTTGMDDGGTRSLRFFAKTMPRSDSPQFEFLLRANTFNREIVAYTDLARRMDVNESSGWMVECYHCQRDVIIVLEDASLNGYVTMDKHAPFDEEHCVLLLKTLARLHAKSLILDERLRRQGRSIPDLYGSLLNEMVFSESDISERFCASGIVGMRALFRLAEARLGDEKKLVEHRFAEWTRNLSRLLRPSGKYRNVICHRDIWTNNIMFQHDPSGSPTGCYLIDFQIFAYCPPAIDFAQCLYLVTDQATRDRHFDSFVRIYHDAFARLLAEDGLDVDDHLPWTAFRQSCADARNIAIVYAAHTLQLMLLSSTTIADLCGVNNRLEDVMYGDERSEIVLHQCEKLPSYKQRLLEIVHEMKDRLPDHPPMD